MTKESDTFEKYQLLANIKALNSVNVFHMIMIRYYNTKIMVWIKISSYPLNFWFLITQSIISLHVFLYAGSTV